MKKRYISPQINTEALSENDILNGSDLLINGEELFSEN